MPNLKRSDFNNQEEFDAAWKKAVKDNELARRKRYRDRNKELLADKRRDHYTRNSGALIVKARERRDQLKRRAFPEYAKEIQEFYKEARRLTDETGIPHVVDHIWPLNGEFSCGSHVPWNLRVITHDENAIKGNKEPL